MKLKKIAISLMAPFFLSPPSTCQSLFHACVSCAALFPYLFQVYEAESLDSFPLSHCSPSLKIKKRKLCLKDFVCGNHNSWLPFSCVCVNSLINITGKDCVLAVTMCHSWRWVSSTQVFGFAFCILKNSIWGMPKGQA